MYLMVHALPPISPQNVLTLSLFFSTIYRRDVFNGPCMTPVPPQNFVTLSLVFSTKLGRGMCLIVQAWPSVLSQNFVTLSLLLSTKLGREMCLTVRAWPPVSPTKVRDTILTFQYKIGKRDLMTVHTWPPFPPQNFVTYPYFSVQNWDEGCFWREASSSLDWQDPLPSQHLQLWQLQVSRYHHLPENNSKIYR